MWCGARNGLRREQAPADRLAGGGVDAGDLERFVVLERREHGDEASREHRLARFPAARRRAGGGLPPPRPRARAGRRRARAPRRGRRVRRRTRRRDRRRRARGRPTRPFLLALQARAELAEVAGGAHVHVADQRGLGRVRQRHDDRSGAAARRARRRARACPAPRAPMPSRPSSPSTATPSSTPAGSSSAAARSPSATASSSPEPDLRTPPGARLTVMRCIGNAELRRQQRGAHPLARLAHRGVGQPDHVVRGETRRHVDFDGDGLPVDADERGTADRGEHGGPPP